MTTTLRWGRELALLDPRFAPALAGMIRQLDAACGPLRARPGAPAGEPDGWDDLTRRGPPERLLPSELALFGAAPAEAARRIADGEAACRALSERRAAEPLGCAVLLDAGPDQLGAPRVAHLAVWLWLAARAREAGAAFRWGVLQDPERRWRTAVDADAGRELLAARSWARGSCEGWQADGERWLVSRDATWPGARRVEVADRGDHLEVVAGRRLHLALPDRAWAAEALGAAFGRAATTAGWWSVTLSWAGEVLALQRGDRLEVRDAALRRVTTRRPLDGRLLAAARAPTGGAATLAGAGDHLRLIVSDPLRPDGRAAWCADDAVGCPRTGPLAPWDLEPLVSHVSTYVTRSPDGRLIALGPGPRAVQLAADALWLGPSLDGVAALIAGPAGARLQAWRAAEPDPVPGAPIALPVGEARSAATAWDPTRRASLPLARAAGAWHAVAYGRALRVDGPDDAIAAIASPTPAGLLTRGVTWLALRGGAAVWTDRRGRERVLVEQARASAVSRSGPLVALATADQGVQIVDVELGAVTATLTPGGDP